MPRLQGNERRWMGLGDCCKVRWSFLWERYTIEHDISISIPSTHALSCHVSQSGLAFSLVSPLVPLTISSLIICLGACSYSSSPSSRVEIHWPRRWTTSPYGGRALPAPPSASSFGGEHPTRWLILLPAFRLSAEHGIGRRVLDVPRYHHDHGHNSPGMCGGTHTRSPGWVPEMSRDGIRMGCPIDFQQQS